MAWRARTDYQPGVNTLCADTRCTVAAPAPSEGLWGLSCTDPSREGILMERRSAAARQSVAIRCFGATEELPV